PLASSLSSLTSSPAALGKVNVGPRSPTLGRRANCPDRPSSSIWRSISAHTFSGMTVLIPALSASSCSCRLISVSLPQAAPQGTAAPSPLRTRPGQLNAYCRITSTWLAAPAGSARHTDRSRDARSTHAPPGSPAGHCSAEPLLDYLAGLIHQLADERGGGLDLPYQANALAGEQVHRLNIAAGLRVGGKTHEAQHRHHLARDARLPDHRLRRTPFLAPGLRSPPPPAESPPPVAVRRHGAA